MTEAADSIVTEFELTDLDADQQLLAWRGVSLVIFTGEGCASCRWARRELPRLDLPVDRLCWIDAGRNGGLVARYEVFHLPALFVVRNGNFHGAVQARLNRSDLTTAIECAVQCLEEDLP